MGSPQSLMEILTQVEDPRKAKGKRHPISAILCLIVVAILGGNSSLEAISQFGRHHGWGLLKPLGFTTRRSPSKATLSRVLRMIDADKFENLISSWVRSQSRNQELQQICIDGKVLRGSREGEIPGVHLLAAYLPETREVIGQMSIEGKGNEYTASLQLLKIVPLKDKVVTADAMFTHREFCQSVNDGGGDYILYAKENQPTLKQDIAAIIEPFSGSFPPS